MRWYLVVLALVAVAVGALFRTAGEFGIPRLREAAWLGILLFGIVANLAVARWQFQDGRRRLWFAFQGLAPGFSVVQPGVAGPPGTGAEYVVIAPAGMIALVVDDLPNTAGVRRARRQAERARALARDLLARVAGLAAAPRAAEAPASDGPAIRMEAAVVFTRRRVTDLKGEGAGGSEEVRLMNPDELAEYLRGWQSPERLPQAARLEIRRRVQSLPVARFGKRQL